MNRLYVLTVVIVLATAKVASAAENVVLITIDGLRWQEVYTGLDPRLARHETFSPWGKALMERFWHEQPEERARLLMPFLHERVFADGVHAGNRDAGSCARVLNPWLFSYPGYNEILTGVVNPAIDSNSAGPNPDRTFMERLHEEGLVDAGDMAAFASWEVFRDIFNVERSGLHVNVDTPAPPDTAEIALLNRLQEEVPRHWETVRHDAFTHHYALTHLKARRPEVLFIGYGEPDDFGHDGRYDQYILAAHRVDGFIREVWETLQSMPEYRDNTAVFITTDHGRGGDPLETWQHHASAAAVTDYMASLAEYEEGIDGSEAIWMAAFGADVPARGQVGGRQGCLTADRVAATLLSWLNVDHQRINPAMAAPLEPFVE